MSQGICIVVRRAQSTSRSIAERVRTLIRNRMATRSHKLEIGEIEETEEDWRDSNVTEEEIAAIVKAFPAWPFRAIGYPSNEVATTAASPGALIRIEEVEPPKIAP